MVTGKQMAISLKVDDELKNAISSIMKDSNAERKEIGTFEIYYGPSYFVGAEYFLLRKVFAFDMHVGKEKVIVFHLTLEDIQRILNNEQKEIEADLVELAF